MTDVSSTSALSGTAALTDAVEKGKDSSSSALQLSEDLNSFLYLLTTQLKYQDPLDPMDSSEFTNQLVQYAEVEQTIQTNSYLETIISQNNAGMSSQAVSYMDQVVQAQTGYVPLQDGFAKFAYITDADATSCVVAVQDSDGNFVKTFTGELTAGRHVVDWDGTDNEGNKLPDGAYKIVVTATGADGKDVGITTTTYGKVTGVAYDGDLIALGMGDVVVNMNSVLAIHGKDVLKPESTGDSVIPPTEDGNGSAGENNSGTGTGDSSESEAA